MSAKNKIITIALLAIVVIAGFGLQKNGGKALAASGDTGINGYAWSDNFGWLQMGGTANSVKVDPATGVMSGYAWSDNIGWINFAPAKDLINFGPSCGYPSAPCNSVKMDPLTRQVSGWAQVESLKSCTVPGWVGCGWIIMQDTAPTPAFGVKYNLSDGKIDATQDKYRWAWSDDFGWIDFSQTSLGNMVIITTGSTYSYTDNYKYPNGIIVNTYADTSSDLVYKGNAAITKGESIYYTLEINNQGSVPKNITLNFMAPSGYVLVGNASCSAGINPCGYPNGGSVTVPPGVSTVKFKMGT